MRSRPYCTLRSLFRLTAVYLGCSGLVACSFFSGTTSKSGTKRGAGNGVLGASLGEYASPVDEQQLAALYAVGTTHAPAPVRPDPDLIVRNLLLQYRETGSTVAREIGRVEAYRMLLGGANVTFTVAPQETYDSTSLLAEMKVAGEICRSLINPSSDDHPGWVTILPSAASDVDANVVFLAQRFLGVPLSGLDAATLANLKTIVDASMVKGKITEASYVPVCTTLILDAEGLLL